MLSVNREGREDLTVNIWAKLDIRFRVIWIVEVLVNPYCGHPQVGNSARICDEIEENSPLVTTKIFTEFHLYKLLGGGRGQLSSFFQKWSRKDVAMTKKYTTGNITFYENEKKGKLSVHNQWRVVHNDIKDSGGVANMKMSIIRIY